MTKYATNVNRTNFKEAGRCSMDHQTGFNCNYCNKLLLANKLHLGLYGLRSIFIYMYIYEKLNIFQ